MPSPNPQVKKAAESFCSRHDRRLVAFSTGCVYPFVDFTSGGATEGYPLTPNGEYANSCVGRERLIEWQSARQNTQALLFRLNYAIDCRYGVLHDITGKVLNGKPVNLTTGYVNAIWQGDATAMALRSLCHVDNPARPLNVTGPETLSVRRIAQEFGKRLLRSTAMQRLTWSMVSSPAGRRNG